MHESLFDTLAADVADRRLRLLRARFRHELQHAVDTGSCNRDEADLVLQDPALAMPQPQHLVKIIVKVLVSCLGYIRDTPHVLRHAAARQDLDRALRGQRSAIIEVTSVYCEERWSICLTDSGEVALSATVEALVAADDAVDAEAVARAGLFGALRAAYGGQAAQTITMRLVSSTPRSAASDNGGQHGLRDSTRALTPPDLDNRSEQLLRQTQAKIRAWIIGAARHAVLACAGTGRDLDRRLEAADMLLSRLDLAPVARAWVFEAHVDVTVRVTAASADDALYSGCARISRLFDSCTSWDRLPIELAHTAVPTATSGDSGVWTVSKQLTFSIALRDVSDPAVARCMLDRRLAALADSATITVGLRARGWRIDPVNPA